MKIKYVEVPEIGLTKCIISDVKYDVNHYLLEHDDYYHGSYHLPNQFVGIARLNPNDEWNSEIGRWVAYAKARAKYDRSFFKRLQLYINERDKEMNNLVDTINALGHRLERARNHREARIEERFSGNDVTFTSEE